METPVTSAAVAPESAAEAPVSVAEEAPDSWVVGDIIKLGPSCPKTVQGAEAQVLKVTAKTLCVKILTAGPLQGKPRSVRHDAVSLVQPSSLRRLSKQGRTVTGGADLEAFPSTGASSTAASAPGSAAQAPVPHAETEEQARERREREAIDLAAALFNDDDDDQ
jgi:hypothetical protein